MMTNHTDRSPTGNASPCVCLMGAALDTGNQGVSALGASLVQNVVDACRPDAHISMFVGNRSAARQTLEVNGKTVPIEILNYRMSPRSRFNHHLFALAVGAFLYRLPCQSLRAVIRKRFPILNRLAESDFVGDIRGGDSFSDIYGRYRFVLGTLPQLIVLWMGTPLHLLPQTYGPYRSAIARRLARHVIRSAASVIARDRASAQVANAMLGAGAKQARLCPDIAFTMHPSQDVTADIEPPLPKEGTSETIGLNISGLLYNGGYSKDNMFGLAFDYKACIIALVEALLAQTEAEILLVPHNYGPPGGVNNDAEACEAVFQNVSPNHRQHVHVLRGRYDQYQVKTIIGRCDFFIGARMHACIAALSQGVPTIGIAYSDKFAGVFETVGMEEYVVEARTLSADAVKDRVLGAYAKRCGIRAQLTPRSREVREQVRAVFVDLLKNASYRDADVGKQSEFSRRDAEAQSFEIRSPPPRPCASAGAIPRSLAQRR